MKNLLFIILKNKKMKETNSMSFDRILAELDVNNILYKNGEKVREFYNFKTANGNKCLVTVDFRGQMFQHSHNGKDINGNELRDLITKLPFRPENGGIYWVKPYAFDSTPELWTAVCTDFVMMPYFYNGRGEKVNMDMIYEIDEIPIKKPSFKKNGY